jgi:hypothetical protein
VRAHTSHPNRRDDVRDRVHAGDSMTPAFRHIHQRPMPPTLPLVRVLRRRMCRRR